MPVRPRISDETFMELNQLRESPDESTEDVVSRLLDRVDQ